MIHQQLKEDCDTFVRNLVNSFDTDKDGSISFLEFKDMLSFILNTQLNEEQIKREFQMLDTENNGQVKLKGKSFFFLHF